MQERTRRCVVLWNCLRFSRTRSECRKRKESTIVREATQVESVLPIKLSSEPERCYRLVTKDDLILGGFAHPTAGYRDYARHLRLELVRRRGVCALCPHTASRHTPFCCPKARVNTNTSVC